MFPSDDDDLDCRNGMLSAEAGHLASKAHATA
jgi:hypothetical protein